MLNNYLAVRLASPCRMIIADNSLKLSEHAHYGFALVRRRHRPSLCRRQANGSRWQLLDDMSKGRRALTS